MFAKPAAKWIYCSGTAYLLSAVLQKETGMDASTYTNQDLFALLGIPQYPSEIGGPIREELLMERTACI